VPQLRCIPSYVPCPSAPPCHRRSYGPGNSTESKFETDSVGKTMSAAVIGTAVTQGLLDLDKPLHEYGVKAAANWSVGGTDFFPQATARAILSQSSGYGRVAPGRYL
jgi:CubicO group peptidase (beta-lactamase class C family)